MSYSWTGDRLRGRHAVPEPPRRHGRGGRARRVRQADPGPQPRRRRVGRARTSKRKPLTYLNDGGGGTTNLRFDTEARTLGDRPGPTLAGTVRNCAGGVTPWGTWITGEETGAAGHGWQFEVGKEDRRPDAAQGHGPLLARSLHDRSQHRLRVRDRGRRRHERLLQVRAATCRATSKRAASSSCSRWRACSRAPTCARCARVGHDVEHRVGEDRRTRRRRRRPRSRRALPRAARASAASRAPGGGPRPATSWPRPAARSPRLPAARARCSSSTRSTRRSS